MSLRLCRLRLRAYFLSVRTPTDKRLIRRCGWCEWCSTDGNVRQRVRRHQTIVLPLRRSATLISKGLAERKSLETLVSKPTFGFFCLVTKETAAARSGAFVPAARASGAFPPSRRSENLKSPSFHNSRRQRLALLQTHDKIPYLIHGVIVLPHPAPAVRGPL